MVMMRRSTNCSFLIIILSYVVVYIGFFCIPVSLAEDTIRVKQVVRDREFRASSNNLFLLLFFDMGKSGRYFGIKYEPLDTVVWVANRDNPFQDESGKFKITQDGNMVLSDDRGHLFTINDHAEYPATAANNTTSATLLDTGNLVLWVGDHIVWQSFDYPFDTWLPGMKLGLFRSTSGDAADEQRRFLTSLPSQHHSGRGAFALGVDPNNSNELVIWRRAVVFWRSGPWNGHNFTYFPFTSNFYFLNYVDSNLPEINFSCFSNESQSYFTYTAGFPIMFQLQWDGNVNIAPLKHEYPIKVTHCEDDHGLNLGTEGCANRDTKAIQTIRPTSPRAADNRTIKNRTKRWLWLAIAGPVASVLILTLLSLFCYLKRNRNEGNNGRSKDGMKQGMQSLMYELKNKLAIFDDKHNPEKKDLELPFFHFSSIKKATDDFSGTNKIGQGGFGPVYKGKLDNGQEIAVKRLLKNSQQGLEEFKNEVILIFKLQHRNLVRLLGCCIQEDERILIYEYMPNKSLDSFIFDVERRALLDWKMRASIIEGIAQGLLYLHKYSRLRIIHRDLKTSNILLDNSMNPKISDFGTARIFGENESRANTNRIVGTYGYMSPEYALDGIFSMKSDIFSFGVMILEIISGKKNTGFYQPDRALNLLGYAWDLWNEGRGLEITDDVLVETCSANESLRYIQVGFLCVQESPADRPTISEVLSMLNNEMIAIPTPRQPAFSTIVSSNRASIPEIPKSCSLIDITISEEGGR